MSAATPTSSSTWPLMTSIKGQVDEEVGVAANMALDDLDLGLGGYAVRDEPFGKQGETIVPGLLFPLLGRLVQHLIVREGMRVGPGHVRVHQGGALTLAHVFRGP